MSYDNRKLVQLFRYCPICTSELVQNENYKRAGAKACPEHGEFYIGRGAEQEPIVIFKTYTAKAKVQRPRWNKGRPGALIRCDQTGALFANQMIAAKTLGIPQGNLSAHLRGDKRAQHVGGYTFSIIDPSRTKNTG